MNRCKKATEVITSSGQLKAFESWEVRRMYDECPALVLQNPDSGEKVKLLIGKECFKNGRMKDVRKKEVRS